MTINQLSVISGGAWSYQTLGKGGRVSYNYQFLKVIPNEYVSWSNLKSSGYRFLFKIENLSLQESRVTYVVVFPSIDEREKLRLQYELEMSDTLSRLEAELLRTTIKI